MYRLRSIIQVMFCCVVLSGGGTVMAADSTGYDSWKFRMGGEDRFRYEYRHDFDLKEKTKDNASWFYNRLRLNVRASYSDEYLNDKFIVFLEGLDARASNNEGLAGANTQKDDLDLHQAYVQIIRPADLDIDVTLGRQELQYGAGRLIAAPTWSNRIRAFDAAVLRYAQNGFSADVLYGSEVKYDTHKFNTARAEDFLTGVYFTYRKNNISPQLEWYYFDFTDIKGASDTQRQTIGARLKMAVFPGTVLDLEIPYQFGHQAGKDIHAYAFHADVAHEFSSFLWQPKAVLAYDQASGDKNTSDGNDTTFVPLYQSTHAPYGLLDMVRWQNIRDAEIKVTFFPTEKLSFTPQADFIWLDNRHGAWYSSSGSVKRTATVQDVGSYLGTELAFSYAYKLTGNIKLEGGYAHFYAGSYLRDTAGGDDPVDWIYTQMAVKF